MSSEAFSPEELPVVIETDGAKISAKEAGEIHYPEALEDTTMIEVSPTDGEHIMRQAAALA